MTISIPFDRHPAKSRSLVLDDDILDAVDHLRVAENPDNPLSRSAMVRDLIAFAIALMTDPKAIAEFVAEHTAKDATPTAPLDLRTPS